MEVKARGKSKQKYGNGPDGAEAILQVHAALLREDDRRQRFFEQRCASPRRHRKAR